MDLNIAGLLVIIFFYVVVLVVGIIAAKKVKVKDSDDILEKTAVAGRDLSTPVAVFTMIASGVGGGYINGSAESVATEGLIWTLAPFGIFIGLICGGLFYARKMREEKYITMLDPIEKQYGSVVVVLVYLASLCGDIFWTASILSALGTSLSVIIGLDVTVAICVSAAITIVYTVIGQMISVAYTDIVELSLITFGLVLSTPFVLTSEYVPDIGEKSSIWLGSVDDNKWTLWCDLAVAMTFGSIPWQSYFQRVLSVRSGRQAQLMSFAAATGALVLVIPSVLIGAAGVSASWNQTSYGISPLDNNTARMILPLVLFEFTPRVVAVIGLGAICAAVMSSMDSSILGSSSMFTNNIYRNTLRKKASDTEIIWIQRLVVLLIGVLATLLALSVSRVYGLFILAADLVFVTVLPQLTCSIYLSRTNTYGAMIGFFVGCVLRLGAGEYYLQLQPLIYYPLFDEGDGQLFPFRTFAFVCSILSIVIFSETFHLLFKYVIPKKYDLFSCGDREEHDLLNFSRISSKSDLGTQMSPISYRKTESSSST